MKKTFRLSMLVLSVLLISGASFIFTSCNKTTTPATDPDQVAYDAADGIRGARLYDHVLNEKLINDTKMTEKPNFFRCKSCHGWDLKGQWGVLIDKASSSTYPKVAAVNLIDEVRVNDGIREIYDAIVHESGRDPKSGVYNEKMPNFGAILEPADIWDLVKFIKETGHQTDDFYTLTTTGAYPTGTKAFSDIGKNGNAAAGLATFNAKCKVCHGADGSNINIYCQGEWLGNMFRGDPHEIQHKAVWGMPIDREHIAAGCTDAGEMDPTGISDDDIRNLMVMGQDTVAFPDYHN